VLTEVDRLLKIGDGVTVAAFIGERIPKTAIDGRQAPEGESDRLASLNASLVSHTAAGGE
jgi:hypothetical protein